MIQPEILHTTATVTNYLTSERGTLYPLSTQYPVTSEDLDRITSICSQEKLFNTLFADLQIFTGRKYSREDAEFFVKNLANNGWEKNSNFVYLVRDSINQIVCAVDIKSADQEAEIGYWADELSRGWMTNAVKAVVATATRAGFTKLYARTKPENTASQEVLKRAGFTESGEILFDGKTYLRFEREL